MLGEWIPGAHEPASLAYLGDPVSKEVGDISEHDPWRCPLASTCTGPCTLTRVNLNLHTHINIRNACMKIKVKQSCGHVV